MPGVWLHSRLKDPRGPVPSTNSVHQSLASLPGWQDFTCTLILPCGSNALLMTPLDKDSYAWFCWLLPRHFFLLWLCSDLFPGISPSHVYEAGGEGDDRGWNGWMTSPTQWTWVWASSESWWWTGRPGVLQSMGSPRVRHDWETELNWCAWLYLESCESPWGVTDIGGGLRDPHTNSSISFIFSEPEPRGSTLHKLPM